MGVGFSLAVMQSWFEILSFSFFGVRVFLVSNARERFLHTPPSLGGVENKPHRTKKTEEEKKNRLLP